jgi:hypothetical protein
MDKGSMDAPIIPYAIMGIGTYYVDSRGLNKVKEMGENSLGTYGESPYSY